MSKRYIVYCHTNLKNNKKYFGITYRKPELRWGNGGCKYLKKNSKGVFQHPAFAEAILKYGWDSFSHEVLYEGLTFEEANAKEMELIAQYKTNVVRYNPANGYNCTDGGDGATGGVHYSGNKHPMYGKHHTVESRRKMSLSRMGEKNHAYGRKGKLGTFYGHKHTEEYKAYMSKIHKGGRHPLARKVMCVETGEIFDTVQAAADKYHLQHTNLSATCSGKHHTCGGFHWEYLDQQQVNTEVTIENKSSIAP